MSKIAIISQPDEGVLIDVSGCTKFSEALEHLSSTLQVSSQFWQGLNVSINLGKLKLSSEDAAQVLAIAKGVGITPSAVYTKNSDTKVAFIEHGINIGEGKPMSLPEVKIDTDNIDQAEVELTGREKPKSTVAKLKLRVADALNKRKAKDTKQSTYKEIEAAAPVQETKPSTPVSIEKEVAEPILESVEDIKETISKRINQLSGEAEVGSDDEVVNAGSVALSELEEQTEEITVCTNETETDIKTEDAISSDGSTTLDTIFEEVEEKELEETSSESNESDVDESQYTEEELFEETVEDEETLETTEASNETDSETEENFEVEEEELDQTAPKTQVVRPVAGGTMYLRQTLRSGQTVSHKGHLIIIGDVNPGAEVMAEGDITVWGSLRGIAHAGIGGNIESEIRALNLQPIQIRIAHAIARAPDKPRVKYSSSHGPETARIVAGKIRVFRSRLE